MEFAGLIERIRSADCITVFRHTSPDCDACGAQFGLVSWLSENFPDKKIHAVGNEICTQGEWPAYESVSNETIRNSLAIVVDTANAARVDDERFSTAQFVIKIDHHPDVDAFGDMQFVFDKAAATCEVLSAFFKAQNSIVSLKTAEYLYAGLLTDTLCFRTTNTTSHTLAMASYLAEFGVRIPQLNQTLFDDSEKEYTIATKIRSSIQHYSKHLVYVDVTEAQLKEWDITASRARSFVSELGHVREYGIWAIFTEEINADGQSIYGASLRAKSVRINDIAAEFNGGGHPQAAGIKGLSKADKDRLLKLLQSRLESEN